MLNYHRVTIANHTDTCNWLGASYPNWGGIFIAIELCMNFVQKHYSRGVWVPPRKKYYTILYIYIYVHTLQHLILLIFWGKRCICGISFFGCFLCMLFCLSFWMVNGGQPLYALFPLEKSCVRQQKANITLDHVMYLGKNAFCGPTTRLSVNSCNNKFIRYYVVKITSVCNDMK